MSEGAKEPGPMLLSEQDWELVGVLIDLQRGKIGNLTALHRVRAILATPPVAAGCRCPDTEPHCTPASAGRGA